MSCVLITAAIDDCGLGPLGAKEAVAMALEHLGGVRVLSVELREPEQLGLGGAFTPSSSRSTPAPPPSGGQATARGSRRPQTAMECCYNCARYRSDRNQDADGNWYWGVCGRTGQPVYDLKSRCGAWARLGG